MPLDSVDSVDDVEQRDPVRRDVDEDPGAGAAAAVWNDSWTAVTEVAGAQEEAVSWW